MLNILITKKYIYIYIYIYICAACKSMDIYTYLTEATPMYKINQIANKKERRLKTERYT
jgi:hypothetical protein